MRGVGEPADVRLLVIFLRSLAHWNQTELAAATGIDKSLISAYEQGDTAPSQKTLEKIVNKVGVPYALAEHLLALFRSLRRARDRGHSTAEPLALAGRLAETLTTAALLGLAPALAEIPILRESRAQEKIQDTGGALSAPGS